ncbi:MAG: hypothetical protein ABIJ56_04905 [Pseudomonadota bacterium]
MKYGLCAYSARLPALALLLPVVFLFSGVTSAGGKGEMESITADISIVSAEEIRTRLTFKISADGRPVRDFKLSGESSFYKWPDESMHCLTETGKKAGLVRVPRADGLTAMKISLKQGAKAKSLSCVMEGHIDPQFVEHVLAGTASGHYRLALTLPAVTGRTGTLNITVHFPDTITREDVMLDDMTAEEFSARFFSSAVTLTASPVPAFQAKTIELILGQNALGNRSDFFGSPQPSDGEITRFVGMKTREGTDLRFSIIVFLVSVFLFVLLLARSAFRRNRSDPTLQVSPYLVFAGISGLTRAVFSLCLVMLFAVFTLSASPVEAMLFFTCAVIMHLRIKAAVPAAVPDTTQEESPEKGSVNETGLANGPGKPKAGFGGWKRAGSLALLLLLVCAAVPAAVLVSGVSAESAVCLGFAFLLSIIFLFFSPYPARQPLPAPGS